MSQPVLTQYLSGKNLYVVEYLAGQFWNKSTPAWESYNQSDWSHYAIPFVEYTSSGIYLATFPAGIAAGSLTTEFVYLQNGVTPLLPGLPGGDSFLTLMQSQGANLQTIAGDGTAPIHMAAAADVIISNGVVGSGTISSSSFPTNLPSAPAQAYVGRVIAFTSGICIGQETNITAYNPTGGVVTVTALTDGPSASDTFVVL